MRIVPRRLRHRGSAAWWRDSADVKAQVVRRPLMKPGVHVRRYELAASSRRQSWAHVSRRLGFCMTDQENQQKLVSLGRALSTQAASE